MSSKAQSSSWDSPFKPISGSKFYLPGFPVWIVIVVLLPGAGAAPGVAPPLLLLQYEPLSAPSSSSPLLASLLALPQHVRPRGVLPVFWAKTKNRFLTISRAVKKRKLNFPHWHIRKFRRERVAKSYMTNSLLICIWLNICAFPHILEALPHFWLCNRSHLNFLIFEENFLSFLSVRRRWSWTADLNWWEV